MDAPPPARFRRGPLLLGVLAGALGLAGFLLLQGRPPGGTGAGDPGGASPAVPRDPAVEAALAKRPDLAGNRVFLLGLDGVDPVLLKELVDADRLPHFKRLMEEGAFGPLRSQQPMLSPLLWTTVATGKFPTEHGVLDFMVRDEEDGKGRTTVSSRNRQVEAIWDIAGRYGRTVGLVGWLASHPAERVNGWAVSERTELLAYLYNQPALPSDEGKTWPPELIAELNPLRRSPSSITRAEITPFLEVDEDAFRRSSAKDEFTAHDRVNNMRLIHAGSENFRAMGLHLWRTKAPDLFCIYFEDIDAVSHNFMAFRDPVTWKPRSVEEILAFFKGDPPPGAEPVDPELVRQVVARVRGEMPKEQRVEVTEGQQRWLGQIQELATGANPELVRKWGRAVDAAYEDADRLLGEVMDALDARTTLLILSDHGFLCTEDDGKPPFDSSFKSRMGGARYHREDGILGAFGHGVRKGHRIRPQFFDGDPYQPAEGTKPPPFPRLVDIAPTVLALLGFPKGSDMPGRVIAEIFDLDLATGEVETYESGRSARLARERMHREERRRLDGGDPVEDDSLDEAMKQLAAVGYVGTEEEGPTRALRHMASSYMEQRRFEEAEEAWGEILKVEKGRARLDALLKSASCRIALGDLEGAEKRVRECLDIDPALTYALATMARLLDLRGDRAGAVEYWERACAIPPPPAALPQFQLRLGDALRTRAADLEGKERSAMLERALALLEETRPPVPGGETGPEVESGKAFLAERKNHIGMVLVDMGRFPEAEAALREAAAFKSDYRRPRNNLSVVAMRRAMTALERLRQSGDPREKEREFQAMTTHREEALGWIDQVLAIDEGDAKAHYNRAEVLLYFPPMDVRAAETELELALKANPNYRRAQALLEKVRAAIEKAGEDAKGNR